MGRLTYGKELLNFRKNSHFHKTNHLRLRRVGPPAPTARENKRQIDETNRTYFKGWMCRRQQNESSREGKQRGPLRSHGGSY